MFGFNFYPQSTPQLVVITPKLQINVCCGNGTQFDDTYSMYLRGKIEETEFRQTIERINSEIPLAYQPSKYFGILTAVLFIFFFITIILTAPFILTSGTFIPFNVPIAFCYFIGAFISICCSYRQTQKAARFMQWVISGENQRFLSRGMQWRLKSVSIPYGRGTRSFTWIEIEITGGGALSPDQPPTYANVAGYGVPIPMNAPMAHNFCNKCGSPLAPDSKFCSSCGSTIA